MGGVINRIKFIQAITKLVFATFIGASLLFFSVNHATANDNKNFEFPETLTEADKLAIQNSNGKYGMTITSSIDKNGDIYWYILVWDTATGKSKIYCGSPSIKKTVAGGYSYNLPSNPL